MSEIKNWYMGQPRNSKFLLAVAFILIVISLFLKVIVEPWNQKLESLKSEVEDKTEVVAWMDQQIKKNKPLIQYALSNKDAKPVNGQSNSRGSLMAQIEQSAKKMRIYSSIQRISPDKVGGVKVWIDKGDFPLYLKWIETLKKKGVNVTEVRATQSKASSKLSVTATFKSH